MGIKKEKVRSGVFVTERITCNLKDSTPDELTDAMKEIFQKIGRVEPILSELENRAKEKMKAGSYLTKTGKLSRRKNDQDLTPLIQDLERVLLRVKETRCAWQKGNIEKALFNMYLATNASWRAQIRPVEPAMFFKGHLEMARTRGHDQTEQRKPDWISWNKSADKLRQKNKHLSKYKLAELVKKELKLDESVDTIRKRLT